MLKDSLPKAISHKCRLRSKSLLVRKINKVRKDYKQGNLPPEWQHESISLTSVIDSLTAAASSDRVVQVVADSGTTYHITRDKCNMSSISSQTVNIRGVGGSGRGYKGFLKPSVLGAGIPAIWFPDLPLQMLLSVDGLKRDMWETHFTLDGDYLTNRRHGTVLPMHKGPTGLPVLDVKFEDSEFEAEECGFVCTPCDPQDAAEVEEDMRPKRLRKSTVLAAPRRRAGRPRKRTKASKLLEHWRMCHFHEPGSKVDFCHECLEFKRRKQGHSDERPERFKTKAPLLLFAADFFGKVRPTSYTNKAWVILFVCDECGFAHGQALKQKSEAPQAVENFVRQIRKQCGVSFGSSKNEKGHLIMGGLRTNEPVLRSEALQRVCDQYNIQLSHSSPYEPEMNGKCERLVQSIKSALRTVCSYVDSRCWDWALSHVIQVWNLRQRSQGNSCCAPQDVVNDITTNPLARVCTVSKRKYLRRFGCLTYFKPHVVAEAERNAALAPKRKKGIHLGFSQQNSGWLVGTYESGALHVYETRNATFCEDILVRNVQELSTADPTVFQQLLERADASAGKTPAAGTEKSVVGDVAEYQLEGLSSVEWDEPRDGPEVKDRVTIHPLGEPDNDPKRVSKTGTPILRRTTILQFQTEPKTTTASLSAQQQRDEEEKDQREQKTRSRERGGRQKQRRTA